MLLRLTSLVNPFQRFELSNEFDPFGVAFSNYFSSKLRRIKLKPNHYLVGIMAGPVWKIFTASAMSKFHL